MIQNANVLNPPPMSGPARAVVLVASAITLLSALAGAYFALRGGESAQWGAFGYELVIAITCVFGVLLGRGKFSAGSGLTAGLIALAWFVGTGMGRLPFHTSPRGVVSDPWFLGRLAGAAVVAGMGALTVLSRDNRAWKSVMVGFGLLLPVALALGFWVGTGGMWFGRPQTGTLEFVRVTALCLAAVACGGLFCFGSDAIIRAFTFGVPQGQPGAIGGGAAKRSGSGSE